MFGPNASLRLQGTAIAESNGQLTSPGESDGSVPPSPVEGGFEHNFFGRIALRFVEAGRRLGLGNFTDDDVADTEAWRRRKLGS